MAGSHLSFIPMSFMKELPLTQENTRAQVGKRFDEHLQYMPATVMPNEGEMIGEVMNNEEKREKNPTHFSVMISNKPVFLR